MQFAVRQANWVRRGAFVLLALWLLVEVPVVCPHGPMSLFTFEAHQGYTGQHAGLLVQGETGSGHHHVTASSIASPAVWGLIRVFPPQDIVAATALDAMTGLSEGAVPILALRWQFAPALALPAAVLHLYRSLPLSPPDQPPRPLSPIRV